MAILCLSCFGLVACAGAVFQQAQLASRATPDTDSSQATVALAAASVAPNSPNSPAALATTTQDWATVPAASTSTIAFAQPDLRGAGHLLVGAPYEVAGNWYTPQHDPTYDQIGLASWYGESFRGQLTANGEVFDDGALTAAHPTLPLPCYARVTNTTNNRSIMVRVNDRGPFSSRRMIDVSARTAELLDFKETGVATVRVEYVAPARLEGDDSAFLLASYRGSDAPDLAPTMVASAAPLARAAPQKVGSATMVVAAVPPVSNPAPAAFVPAPAPSFRAAARPVAVASGAPFDPFQTLSDPRALWSPAAFRPPDRFKPQAPAADGSSLRSSFAADERVSGAFEAIALLSRR